MIYPNNFERKIGFENIRKLLCGNCLSTLGSDAVGKMEFMSDAREVNDRLAEVREYRRLCEESDDLSLQYIFDVRQCVARLKLKGTHMDEAELYDLMRNLHTANNVRQCVVPYPALWKIAKDVKTFPELTGLIAGVIDKFGHMKDNASPTLMHLRTELKKVSGSISRTLYSILQKAQAEGIVDKDVAPTMRDGRLVIPIAPALKKRIPGITHDESATGRTLFIEPTVTVEANNKVRELEAEERREVIRILKELSDKIRPYADTLLETVGFLGTIDFIQAKAQFASQYDAIEPEVDSKPCIDWVHAVHPLLKESLNRQQKDIVPLDIELGTDKGKGRILIISGPNAGGKSVCLKTVGLLQYMVQCGVSIPLKENSRLGVFEDIMIDIGDEQSIEDDLSTYSSHLMNMKVMIKKASARTLLLIDEFGTGTEPQIGGAIAEAILKQFWKKGAWGVITTHYQNLKHFAEGHPGVINGAMLYDRKEMMALFQLQTGRPGSSFAIEIARKTGIPEEVIADASNIVGQDYIQSDKYLQDIVRDKRYWEHKRQTVHQREKDMERTISHFESSVEEIEAERKAILKRAKQQAEELIKEANRRIENTIREIREAEAEKEATKALRNELNEFKGDINDIDTNAKDAAIEKKMRQIMERRERKAKRKENREKEKEKEKMAQASGALVTAAGTREQEKQKNTVFHINDCVKIKGTNSTGVIEDIKGKDAMIIMGDIHTRIPLSRIEPSSQTHNDTPAQPSAVINRMTREVIDQHRAQFYPDIDVRGMRGDEALLKVQHFVDDAILMGVSNIKILHGKGNGILRTLIRQYLDAIPNVISYRDEHVQFGGAGITKVELG